MLRTIFSLEWKILRRDRSFGVILALFALFVGISAVSAGHHTDALEVGCERAVRDADVRLDGLNDKLKSLSAQAPMTAKDPRDPVWMGQQGASRVAILPPSPLAAVAVGQRELHPQAVRVSTGQHLVAQRETEIAMIGPTRMQTGALDPAFILVVLLPLIVIALSFELLSGERERGTLAMLLSQPISQTQLLFGKAAARGMALLVATIALSSAGLAVAGVAVWQPEVWLPMGLFTAVVAGWTAFWFAAAIAVNAWGSSSERNALTLVGVWLILVVVLPGLLQVTVDTLVPPPSRVEVMHEAREAAQDIEKELVGLQGRHDQDPKTKAFGRKLVRAEKKLAERSAPVVKELRDQGRRRQALLTSLQLLSPAMVVQTALEDVAGSSAARQLQFEAQVDAFHGKFQAWFFAKAEAGQRFKSGDLAEIPAFSYVKEPATELIQRVGLAVALLLLLSAALIALAVPGLRRIGKL